jgi:DNA-binding MarR family transcriptional regulator
MTPLGKRADTSIEKRRLRMWIRMLRTTRSVESGLRGFLRENHATTLPRFDVMAALERAEDGLKMSALSKQLLVSNGNVTGIIDRLADDGLVERIVQQHDRRSTRVCLTKQGRISFAEMAIEHEELINDLFSDINPADLDMLADIFGRLKQKENNDELDG